MEQKHRMSATARTAQLLMVAFLAFLFGGYVNKGSDWPVLILSGAALAGVTLMLIRELWKPTA
jgi:hypothetical protein